MPNESRTDTTSTPHVRGIDPAFGPAIKAGVLSPADAAQRGNREALALKLAARHRIPIEDAYDVADNRTSLARMIQARSAGHPAEAHARTGRSSSGRLQFTASVAFVLIAVAVVVYNRDSSESPTAIGQPRSSAAAPVDGGPAPKIEVRIDAEGRPILIRAARPAAVLFSYCGRTNRQAVALAQGPVPDATLWLGIYYEAGDAQAISILKDYGTGDWIAGDGRSPIPAFPVTEQQLGTTHQLVRAKP